MTTSYRGPVVDMWMRPPTPGFLATRSYVDSARIKSNNALRGWTPSTVIDTHSMDQMLDEMDASRVVLGVVPVRRGGRLGEVANSDVRELVRTSSGRFVGLGAPALDDLRQGLEECRQLLAEPEFAGIVMEPGLWTPARYVDDPKLYPLYEQCTEHRKPVMLTVGGNGGPDVSYTASDPVMRVARDFPSLTIIVTHGGWPRVGDALNLAYRCPNVILSPDVYLLGMYGWRDYVDAAHGFLQNRILFGSGFPFCPFDHAIDQVGSHLSPAAAERVFFSNACSALGLDPLSITQADVTTTH